MVFLIFSPPGTSPMPALPLESVRMMMLRVKKGPCAPLRFNSMPSRPATGITSKRLMVGVVFMIGKSGDKAVNWLDLKRSYNLSCGSAHWRNPKCFCGLPEPYFHFSLSDLDCWTDGFAWRHVQLLGLLQKWH